MIEVADCKTAADVRRLTRDIAARRRRLGQTALPPTPPPSSPPTPAASSAPSPTLPPSPPPSPTPAPPSTSPPSPAVMLAEAERLLAEAERYYHAIGGRRPTLRSIVNAVAEHYRIAVPDLISRRQLRDAAHARGIGFVLCRILTAHGYKAIGEAFGDRDHTTVLHHIRKFTVLLKPLHHCGLSLDAAPRLWVQAAEDLYRREFGKQSPATMRWPFLDRSPIADPPPH